MRIKKNILVLFAAASLATASINPVNTYAWGSSVSTNYGSDSLSPVNSKAQIGDNYKYSICTSSSDYIKYTGKELSNIPISYSSETDGDYILKDGIDYQIVGYAKINAIDDFSEEYHLTKGIPTEPGYYRISIEGINSFKGYDSINIAIIDPKKLSSFDFRIDEKLFINSNQIELTLDYYDTEKQKDISLSLTEGKDYNFNGWTTKKIYKKNSKNPNKIKWSKKSINESGKHYFKISGLNEYKNQTIIKKYDVNGAQYISSHDFGKEPYYNPCTKKFEQRFKSEYLTEGKDYSVNYCSKSEVSDYEEFVGISKKHNWKPGYPKKSGNYVFMLKGKNGYKGYKAFSCHYDKTINPQIIKGANSNTTVTFFKDTTLAICPSKTGEYTIKTTASADKSYALYADLYSSAYKLIKPTKEEGENTVSSSIKTTLNAGEVYYLNLSTSLNIDKEIACTISIDNSYSYKNPKAIVKNNCIYSITKHADKNGSHGEVAVIGVKKKSAKKVTISDYVKINGQKYKVTHIDYNAFKGNKKLTTVKTGNTVESICAGAFAGCKKLKTIVLGKNIKNIENKALCRTKGKKLTIKVPKKNKKAYAKLIKNAKTNNYVVK